MHKGRTLTGHRVSVSSPTEDNGRLNAAPPGFPFKNINRTYTFLQKQQKKHPNNLLFPATTRSRHHVVSVSAPQTIVQN